MYKVWLKSIQEYWCIDSDSDNPHYEFNNAREALFKAAKETLYNFEIHKIPTDKIVVFDSDSLKE